MLDNYVNNYDSLPSIDILRMIGKFIKEQRLNLNKSQEVLALEAGVNRSTISLLESGENTSLITFIQVLRALNKLSMLKDFQEQNNISPILMSKILLKSAKKKRKYARANRTINNENV